MATDVHAHFYPPSYAQFVRRQGSVGASIAEQIEAQRHAFTFGRFMAGAIEERLDLLSAAGIERQILSISSQFVLVEDAALCRDLAAAANDALAKVCAQHPDRFGQFACLPLVDPDASVAELERCWKELRVQGVTFPTHVLGRRLDWDGLEPVYSALEQMGAILFLHPCAPPHQVTAAEYDDWGITPGVYFLTEDAHALLRMVCGGVLERHPGLRVICPHLGGPIPFFLPRLEAHLRPRSGLTLKPPQPLGHYLRLALYDTVSRHPPALRCACETMGMDRLVLGTDFPYEDMGEIVAAVEALALSPADRAAVMEQNVRPWMRGEA